MKNLYLVIILCASLSGCITKKQPKHPENSINNAEIESQLTDIARSIERSLGTLALTQETTNPPLLNTAPLVTPEGGMGGTADIDWTGPIEPLIQKLAEMTDYKLKVLGTSPAISIIVSITQQKAIIADILKNTSLQAGKRANIMVFPANRVIELRYRAG
jgi:defect in organelle trafficking protein DotD